MTTIKIFILLLCASSTSYAASITQTKNNKILISLDGDTANVGQIITLMDTDNKQVATATITQVKNGKAIATVKSGKVDGSESISFGEGSDDKAADEISPDSYSRQAKGVYRLNSTKMSVVVTSLMNNMITKQSDGTNPTPNTEDVTLKGSSIGVTGIIDYPFNNWLILRGTLGYEPFNAAGTSTLISCDNLTSRECTAMINYLSAGGFARFNITKSRSQLWVGVGATAKFPMSKTTTALRTDDIKMTMTFAGAVGLDFFINNKSFIPVSAEYQMFQASDTVTANIILLRVGYGWAF